jgi:hypothetical protein
MVGQPLLFSSQDIIISYYVQCRRDPKPQEMGESTMCLAAAWLPIATQTRIPNCLPFKSKDLEWKDIAAAITPHHQPATHITKLPCTDTPTNAQPVRETLGIELLSGDQRPKFGPFLAI